LIAEHGYMVKADCNHYVATLLSKQSSTGEEIFCPICTETVKITEVVKHEKKVGWKAHIDQLALRWMLKILLSHVVEILAKEEGFKFPKDSFCGDSYIPQKPLLEVDQQEVLERFRQERLALLDKSIKKFAVNRK